MKPAIFLAISSFALCTASGQTPAPDAGKSSEAAQLEALEKKIDQQNAKIDALSQEILRLEQQLSHVRPGVMIGEGAPPHRQLPVLPRALQPIPRLLAIRTLSRAERPSRPSLNCTK